MCRRIMTHYMHHDVASPMVIDVFGNEPQIYANPLRTNFHRCELELMRPPQQPLQWLLNTPLETCPYHSCCLPHLQVEYCDDIYHDKEWEEDSLEPEECHNFILEHHHECLPYFGGELPAHYEKIPATWRGLARLRGGIEDWFPEFSHDPKHRAAWEAGCFAECEKLYNLENDLETLVAVAQDLAESRPACPRRILKGAQNQVLVLEEELAKQRRLVFHQFEWASDPCDIC
ncbi:hypothetical protein NUW58_g1103 [Xylaria curta]|uniref:Uncharacterized protein n=1 Tax=Xylaria curta TaxID=42375 RepID=A0ACC1PMX4_9PEZI|nr:hypothetical protein NUW58_g1103 [Xylaria curta]